jgi:hypothetical protein
VTTRQVLSDNRQKRRFSKLRTGPVRLADCTSLARALHWVKLSFMLEPRWDEAAQQINDCEYLFATSIREIEELTLELIVYEAKPQVPILTACGDSGVERMLVGSQPIANGFHLPLFPVGFRQAANGFLCRLQRVVWKVPRTAGAVHRELISCFPRRICSTLRESMLRRQTIILVRFSITRSRV